MSTRHIILLLSIALLASFTGALAYRMVFRSALPPGAETFAMTQEAASDIVGSRRPDYSLGSDTGEIVTAADFDGSVVLVNFWATWCKPCREEMPMLVDLQHELAEQDFQVVGIALDEVQQARDFAAEIGVDYPVLVGSTDVMAVVRSYGNQSGVLPYSVLIDRDGLIQWVYLGALQLADLRQRVLEIL